MEWYVLPTFLKSHFLRVYLQFIGAVIIIAGAVVVTVAKNTQYLLGGRFTLGLGVAITTTAAPAYVVEMSPPQWRGRLTGLYNTFYYSGSILCSKCEWEYRCDET